MCAASAEYGGILPLTVGFTVPLLKCAKVGITGRQSVPMKTGGVMGE